MFRNYYWNKVEELENMGRRYLKRATQRAEEGFDRDSEMYRQSAKECFEKATEIRVKKLGLVG